MTDDKEEVYDLEEYGGSTPGKPVGSVFMKKVGDELWERTLETANPRLVAYKYGDNARNIKPVYSKKDFEFGIED